MFWSAFDFTGIWIVNDGGGYAELGQQKLSKPATGELKSLLALLLGPLNTNGSCLFLGGCKTEVTTDCHLGLRLVRFTLLPYRSYGVR